MTNIGTFTIENSGWVKLEDVIKEKIEDFVFEAGKTYLLQNFEHVFVCVDSQPPTAKGFLMSNQEIFSYTHQADSSIYLKPMYFTCTVNISE